VQRGLQILVLALIGAFFGAAQCNMYCSALFRNSPSSDMAGCHGHSPQHNPQKPECLHHDFQVFSPESQSDFGQQAGQSVVQFSFAVPVLGSPLPAHAHEIWIKLDSAPPPLTSAVQSLPALRI
jgi:hypothetical protein